MSRSMIKQQNSGATAHVVLYTPRQSTNTHHIHYTNTLHITTHNGLRNPQPSTSPDTPQTSLQTPALSLQQT